MPIINGVSTSKGPKITIDLNVVITTIFGFFIIWMFNSWAAASKTRDENREKAINAQVVELNTATRAVGRIDLTLPQIQQSVTDVKAQVAEVKNDVKIAVTEVKSDLRNAQQTINEIKLEQARARPYESPYPNQTPHYSNGNIP